MNVTDPAWWPGSQVEVYSFDKIPIGRDLFLIGSAQVEDLRREWERYLAEPDGTTPRHPNESLTFTWCAAQSISGESCDLNVCIDMTVRYHGAVRKLPRSKFVTCVHFWNYQKRPYLVVSQDWFDEIQQELYSLYALVDAIGVRKLMDSAEGLSAARIVALKARVDEIAAQHADHAFFSFADSVIIKTNWSARAGEYTSSYQPERFLDVVQEVRGAIKAALGLASYAVVTQGANHLQQPTPMELSPKGSHVFLGSLGMPFANLMEIDAAAREAIHEKSDSPKYHPATEFYLSESFAASLRLKYEQRDRLWIQMTGFTSKLGTVGPSAYLPVNADELLPLLTRDSA